MIGKWQNGLEKCGVAKSQTGGGQWDSSKYPWVLMLGELAGNQSSSTKEMRLNKEFSLNG